MKKKNDMCMFADDGCPNEAEFEILGMCKVCYNGLRYWRGRTRAHKMARQSQLQKLNARMEFMLDNPHSMPRPRKKSRRRARS